MQKNVTRKNTENLKMQINAEKCKNMSFKCKEGNLEQRHAGSYAGNHTKPYPSAKKNIMTRCVYMEMGVKNALKLPKKCNINDIWETHIDFNMYVATLRMWTCCNC